MKLFKLSGIVTISVYTEVEANSLEEAIEISKERDIERFHFGAKDQQKEVWVSDSYDGEVSSIEEN